MTLYVVTREGVYRHEIIGIFSDLEGAKIAAKLAVLKEPDNYHKFAVLEYELNVMIAYEHIPEADETRWPAVGGEWKEPRMVCLIQKEEVVHV